MMMRILFLVLLYAVIGTLNAYMAINMFMTGKLLMGCFSGISSIYIIAHMIKVSFRIYEEEE